MSKTKLKETPPPKASAPASRRGVGLLPAAAAALLVARPLVTSDGAAGAGDGAVFVMLWIVLAGAWLVGQLRRGKLSVRFGWTDALLMLLIGWHTLAGVRAVAGGAPRPAINALWEWIGLGLSFLLVRQLFATAARARALAAVMIALGAALSAIGLHQYFIGAEQARARYEQIKDDPEKMIQEAGAWYPPGSPERIQFENRLEGDEPLATFALENSLAGYLAPWLIVALAIAALPRAGGGASWRAWLVAALLAAPLAGCLLLTKSRAGCLATAAGVALLWGVARLQKGAVRARFLWGGAAVVALLAVLAASTGALDREALSEAGKSLGYRMQYWQSTLSMIHDHPLLGVGPGQFQDHYTAYKLPEASEEIQDPHNFLLEIWATAGTPAALLLLAALAAFTWRTLVSSSPHKKDEPEKIGLLVVGAAAGVFLAHAIGLMVGMALDGAMMLLAGASILAAMLLLSGWIRRGALTAAVCWAAAAALLINLLAAGGIGFPGVAGSLWVLFALGLNLADSGKKLRTYSPHAAWIWTAAAFLLAVLCYVTAYRPVLNSRALLAGANTTEMLHAPAERAELLRQALASDPQSAQIALRLANQRLALWQQAPTPSALAAFDEAAAQTRGLAPHSSAIWGQSGDWALQIYRANHEQKYLDAALAQYRRAVELYPTSARLRAKLAVVLDAAQQPNAARTEAAEALRLDDITRKAGHKDRFLKDELRRQMKRITERKLEIAD